MVSWSGRRKALTILFFTAPTLIGILLFNIFPMLLSVYTSFTNRNKFHPNPDCSVALTGILDPVCWPVFRENAPRGLGEPYTLQDPLLKNYADLVGKIFSGEALLSAAMLGVVFAPLVVSGYLDRRFERQASRPVSSAVLWAGALILGLALAFALNVRAAYDTLLNTGDFLIVVFRTLVFVVLRVPFSFLLGLTLAIILNSQHLPGRTFFRVALFIPWAASSLAILIALIWQFFFRDQGVINQVLAAFGVE
ncbi:MAG: carbohydrate ABC transporter permease, partial [Anaerolineales bacterium]